MRILLITAEAWNDAVYGNNVLTNWFTGFDADFAQIYCSPDLPYNHICDRYFQITDTQMVRSLYTGKRAGSVVWKPSQEDDVKQSKVNAQRTGSYKWLKQLSLYIHTPMMMVRDAIWMWGRYDESALNAFVSDFKPDVVFCPRMVTPKLMRLEKKVSKMTDAPFVAFTADNEASLNCYSWSPLFWLRRFAIHKKFKEHVGLYRHYFMFSEEQAEEYHKEYGLPTSCLYKCGEFNDRYTPKKVNNPIRMIYAGRLYCNRWKTLAAIGEALEQLNESEIKMVLDVYTAETLTSKQKKTLNRYNYLHVHSAITPSQLAEEYEKADIALHVESFDKGYRAATHYSFSTKIIDLMASFCAILAICWEKHSGYVYLKKHDAALCVSDYKDILPLLQRITQQPSLIQEYAEKAWECGVKYHTRKIIQNQIHNTFNKIIQQTDGKVFDNV